MFLTGMLWLDLILAPVGVVAILIAIITGCIAHNKQKLIFDTIKNSNEQR